MMSILHSQDGLSSPKVGDSLEESKIGKRMTVAKLKELVLRYQTLLREIGNHSSLSMSEENANSTADMISDSDRGSHFLFMCDMVVEFVDKGEVDKAMRWLGFLQGALWSRGYYTLTELKDHSRSS